MEPSINGSLSNGKLNRVSKKVKCLNDPIQSNTNSVPMSVLSSSSNEFNFERTRLSSRTLRFHPYLDYPYYFQQNLEEGNNSYSSSELSPHLICNVLKPIPIHKVPPPNSSTHTDEYHFIDLQSDICSGNDLSSSVGEAIISPIPSNHSDDLESSDATIHACYSPPSIDVIEIDSSSDGDSDDTVPQINTDLNATLPMQCDTEQSLPLLPSTSRDTESIVGENSALEVNKQSKDKVYSSSLVSKDSLKMKLKLVPPVLIMNNNLVIPFNEFYYGEVISGPSDLLKVPYYDTVRVKCPVCYDVLTNVTVISHYLKHFNFHSLKNPARAHFTCHQCLKTFRTLYHLQFHINRHSILRDNSARECLICENEFISDLELGLHFRNAQHPPQDMPYSCEICYNYRTSFYSNLWQHFTSVHEGEYCVICPYCLKYYEILRLDKSRDCYLPPAFQNHIEKHVKGPNYACFKCRLMFLNVRAVNKHDSLCHTGKPFAIAQDEDSDFYETSHDPLKSVKHLKFFTPRGSHTCAECKQPFTNATRHFLRLFDCSKCHYQTFCSVNANIHKRKCATNLLVTRSRVRSNFREKIEKIACPCNFISHYGDEMAEHLSTCCHDYVTLTTRTPKSYKSNSCKGRYLLNVCLLSR